MHSSCQMSPKLSISKEKHYMYELSVQSRSKSVGRSRFLTTDLKVGFRSTDLKRLFPQLFPAKTVENEPKFDLF